MQDLLHNMTGRRETNPERLAGALMNSTLMADEAAFVDMLNHMEGKHWQGRLQEVKDRLDRDKSERLDSRNTLPPADSPTTAATAAAAGASTTTSTTSSVDETLSSQSS